MVAPNNRTISLSAEEQEKYLAYCGDVLSISGDCVDRVILGDALEAMAAMKENTVDLLIADPPYNLNKRYGSGRFARLSDEDYAAFTERWLDAALRLLKPTASVYVCSDWRSGVTIAPLLEKKLRLRNRITWQREKGRGASANWKNCLEDIWFCTAGDDYTFDLAAVKQRRTVLAPYRENGKPKDWFVDDDGNRTRYTCPSNFWDDITVPYWSMPENTDHPTQKPEKLIAKLVLASSRPGELVFDPFGGSGTTAVVAKKLGRRFLTVEREPYYAALAVKRLLLAADDTRIQGYNDGVFLPRHAKNPKSK